MKKFLRSLRRVKLINKFLRVLIKKNDKLRPYWPVAGVVNCQFNGINFKYYSNCDDRQVDHFYYNTPFHEYKIFNTIIAFAKVSSTVMDIGANTGLHSIIMSACNPKLKVYSIEPYEPNYMRLRKNIYINRFNNIEILSVAIGAENGKLIFNVPQNNSITDVSSAIDDHGKGIYPELEWKKIEIEQCKLDNIIQRTGKIDFFKCDVEGFEDQVLKGGTAFFAENRPPFVMEIEVDDDKCRYFNSFMEKYGYHIYYIGEDGLIRLDSLYNFSTWANFVFTSYRHPENYIPFSQINDFVLNCKHYN